MKEEPEELSDAWMLNWTNEEDKKPLDIKPVKTEECTSHQEADLQDNGVHEIKREKTEVLDAPNTEKLTCELPFKLKEVKVTLKRLDDKYLTQKATFAKLNHGLQKYKRSWHKFSKESEIYLANLCQKATTVTSSMKNQMVYKCPDCKIFYYYSWSALKQHIYSSGHLESHHSMLELNNTIEKLVCHECKICNKKLICDAYFIGRHVTRNHNITRLDYMKKFSDDQEKKILTLIKRASLSNSIANQCQYTCKVCKKIFQCYQSIHLHFRKTNHNETSRSSRNFLTKVVLHQCHFCSHTMLCERNTIAEHLKSVHKLSLENYANETGFKQSWRRTVNSLEFCAPTTPVSRTVANMCQFTCNTCSYTRFSWAAFISHLTRKGHGRCEALKFLTKTVLHQCYLCGKRMLCDKHHIRKHVIRQHHMQLKNYSAKADAISRDQCHQ